MARSSNAVRQHRPMSAYMATKPGYGNILGVSVTAVGRN